MKKKVNHILKLKLNKTTIAKLNEQEMNRVKGGHLNNPFDHALLTKIEIGDTNCTGRPTTEITNTK